MRHLPRARVVLTRTVAGSGRWTTPAYTVRSPPAASTPTASCHAVVQILAAPILWGKLCRIRTLTPADKTASLGPFLRLPAAYRDASWSSTLELPGCKLPWPPHVAVVCEDQLTAGVRNERHTYDCTIRPRATRGAGVDSRATAPDDRRCGALARLSRHRRALPVLRR